LAAQVAGLKEKLAKAVGKGKAILAERKQVRAECSANMCF
jgi:hypothetical protein